MGSGIDKFIFVLKKILGPLAGGEWISRSNSRNRFLYQEGIAAFWMGENSGLGQVVDTGERNGQIHFEDRIDKTSYEKESSCRPVFIVLLFLRM